MKASSQVTSTVSYLVELSLDILLSSRLYIAGDPLQTLVQPLPSQSTAGLDLPLVAPQALQVQLLRDLCRRHAALHVLQ